MLYAEAADPVLRATYSYVDSQGLATARACADDLGAAARPTELLRRYLEICMVARTAANLKLKGQQAHHHTLVGGLLLARGLCDPRLVVHLPAAVGSIPDRFVQ